jgi:hypothetical protein
VEGLVRIDLRFRSQEGNADRTEEKKWKGKKAVRNRRGGEPAAALISNSLKQLPWDGPREN